MNEYMKEQKSLLEKAGFALVREEDGCLRQPRVYARQHLFERSGKAEDDRKDARGDGRERRNTETTAPHAVQLLQIVLVLRGKAYPAVLHG